MGVRYHIIQIKRKPASPQRKWRDTVELVSYFGRMRGIFPLNSILQFEPSGFFDLILTTYTATKSFQVPKWKLP